MLKRTFRRALTVVRGRGERPPVFRPISSASACLIRINAQAASGQSHAPGHQKGRVGQCGALVIAEHLGQQRQQGAAGVHATAEFCNRFASMPPLLPFDQNGAVTKRQPEAIELSTDVVIGSPVNNPKVGNARLEFTAQGELPTEWAAAVVDEG